MKNLVLFFFSICLLQACNDEPLIDTSKLLQSWTRSFEEETPDSPQIFRPSDYKTFPLARFRNVFHFKPNGKCDFWVLAPNDAHYFTTGTWSFLENKNLLVIEDKSLDIVYRYKVIRISENLLEMELEYFNKQS